VARTVGISHAEIAGFAVFIKRIALTDVEHRRMGFDE
jgi:hypothetical protein